MASEPQSIIHYIIRLGSKVEKRLTKHNIQINTGPTTPDYFHPLRFSYMDKEGQIVEDLIPELKSRMAVNTDLVDVFGLDQCVELNKEQDQSVEEVSNDAQVVVVLENKLEPLGCHSDSIPRRVPSSEDFFIAENESKSKMRRFRIARRSIQVSKGAYSISEGEEVIAEGKCTQKGKYQ